MEEGEESKDQGTGILSSKKYGLQTLTPQEGVKELIKEPLVIMEAFSVIKTIWFFPLYKPLCSKHLLHYFKGGSPFKNKSIPLFLFLMWRYL